MRPTQHVSRSPVRKDVWLALKRLAELHEQGSATFQPIHRVRVGDLEFSGHALRCDSEEGFGCGRCNGGT
jgi:hypothetical protein